MTFKQWKEDYHDELWNDFIKSGSSHSFSVFRLNRWNEQKHQEQEDGAE